MKNLKKDILGKIKKEKIQPIPRVIFFLKNFGFWGLFGASILVGAAALSLIFFSFFSVDRELFGRPHFPIFGMAITTAFLFWLVLFLLLFLAAIFGIRHTREGYKISTTHLLSGNLMASFVLATGFLFFGGSEEIEEFFAMRAPMFSHFEGQKEIWEHPEQGFLGGEVREMGNGEKMILRDFSGKEWEVLTEEIPDDFWENAPPFLRIGERVKVVGDKKSESSFEAEMILPWKRMPFWREEMPPKNFERNFPPIRSRE